MCSLCHIGGGGGQVNEKAWHEWFGWEEISRGTPKFLLLFLIILSFPGDKLVLCAINSTQQKLKRLNTILPLGYSYVNRETKNESSINCMDLYTWNDLHR